MIETPNPEPNDQDTTTETLLTVEQLEALPTYQKGVIVTAVQEMCLKHKAEGRDRDSRAIAYEWVVK